MKHTNTEYELTKEALRRLDTEIENESAHRDLWEVQLFNETGKWKYTAYVVLTKPDYWFEFLPWVDAAMNSTPPAVRGVSFNTVPQGWTATLIRNPLGFPIIVTGK